MNILSNISANIDTIIVVIFLAINLAIGFYYGRDIKNIKEYALGNRNFSTATLVATIIATWIGGSSLGFNLYGTYSQGLYFILPALGDAISFLIIGYFIAPRLGNFLGKMSVAEVMGSVYSDNRIRGISAISAVIPAIGNVAMQFTILAIIIKYLFGNESAVLIILCCSIVILYSLIGGIKAVTFTDIFQFATFGIFIPILAIIIWNSFDDKQVFSTMLNTNNLFDYKNLLDFSNLNTINAFLIFGFFLIPGLDPALFQRLLMAEDVKQVTKICFYVAGITFTIYLILDLIGAFILADNILLESEDVLQVLIDNYVGYGFRGMLIIGIMAMAMSTADSYINTSSVLITNDLLKAIDIKISDKQELSIIRIVAGLVGIVAVIVSMYATSLLDMILATYSFYMPVVSVPLLLTIFGFRSNSNVILWGMFSGIVAVIVCTLFINVNCIIVGMVANLATIFVAHHLYGKPEEWINTNNYTNNNNNILDRKLYSIKSLFDVQNYVQYLPKQNIVYSYFAFALFLTISNALTIEQSTFDKYSHLIVTIQILIFTIATLFLCKDLWCDTISKKYLSIIWFISVFIGFILSSSFFVLLSDFSHVSLIILTIHLTFSSLLLGWRTALIMILLGTSIVLISYQYYIEPIPSEHTANLKLKLLYTIFVICGFALTILKNKQEYLEATEAKADELEGEVGDLKEEVDNLGHVVGDLNNKVCELNEVANFYSVRVEDQAKEIERLGATAQKILNNVNHELRLPVGNVVNFAEMLSEGLEKYSKEHQKMLLDEVLQNSNRLSSMILNMLDLAMLNAKKIELKKQTINLSEMIYDRVKNCAKIYLQGKHIDFEMNIEPEVFVFVDPNYIKQTIDNLVINAITYSEKGTIEVSLSQNLENNIEIVIKDQGIGIPKHELYDIFTPFKMGSKTDTPAQGRGVGLALCKAAIEAHGGVITVESDGVSGARFVVLLPLHKSC